MSIFKEFFYALVYQDFERFSNFANLITIIYVLAFFILFLENSVIFAFFLPGDTLLVFLGMLIARDVLNFPLTLGILTIASSLGSWLSYLQGKWLKYHKLTKRYFVYFPEHYQHLADRMFSSYGLFALFIGRFIVFVRTLLPVMIGLSKLDSMRFHFFNWVSAFVWTFILTLLGFIIGKTEFVQGCEQKIMCYVIVFVVFIISIIVIIVQYVRKVFFGSHRV